MWRAFDTVLQRRVTASEAVELVGESAEARNKAYKEKRFVCPACGMEVSLRRSRAGRWYFSHVATKNGCEYYYWSEKEEWAEEIHDEFKQWLAEKLRYRGIDAEIEKIMTFENYKLIPDIYYEVGRKKIAIEVVVNSPRTKDDIIEKSRRYADQGIYVWWIFYWKYKRREDGLTLLDIAKADLDKQRITKRMFRKGSVYRLIHAIHQGRIFFFDDVSPPSGDEYSIVAVHLLWEGSNNSLVGIMPWVLNYSKPFHLYLDLRDVPQVKLYPEDEIIQGPFKIALPPTTPHQQVAVIGYSFELRLYGQVLALTLRIGKGIAHRYYLERSLKKGVPYTWGVILQPFGNNKWLGSISWPPLDISEITSTDDVVRHSRHVFWELIKSVYARRGIPKFIYNLPVLVWNPDTKQGYYLGKSLGKVIEGGFELRLSEKDINYLQEVLKHSRFRLPYAKPRRPRSRAARG
nr:competence protein CoiA family protein [Thermococcus sp. CX2]